MVWTAIKDVDGNVVSCGERAAVTTAGQTAVAYAEPQPDLMEAMGAHYAAKNDARKQALDAYTTKVKDESISHAELVKLLKLKGVI